MSIEELKEKLNNKIFDFVKINEKNQNFIKANDRKILIDGFIDAPTYISASAITAKAINEIDGAEPIVIVNFKKQNNASYIKSYNSFGIINFLNISLFKKNFILLTKALFSAIAMLLKASNKEKLLNYKHNGIKVGDLIYDSHIRFGNNYRNFKIFSIPFFLKSIESFFYYHLYIKFFEKHKISYVILSHRVYTVMGLLARIAAKNKAKVIISRTSSIRLYKNENPDEIFLNEFIPERKTIENIINKKHYLKTDDYLKSRFSGNIKQHDAINAYKNKKNYNKEQLIELYNLNPDWPIVYIMPHAFSDAPHSFNFYCFNDYYEWFIETVKYINNIEGVNWLIKPHPSAHMYGEVGEVEEIIEKNNLNNLHIVPVDMSTSTVYDSASTIVTVCGTIGIEVACIGIKPIIAGESVYSGFGVAHEPKSKEEYFNMLANINKLNKLSENDIIMAKAILFWYHIGAFPDSKIINKNLNVPPTKSEKESLEKKIEAWDEMINSIKKHNYPDDIFYKKVKNLIINDQRCIKSYD